MTVIEPQISDPEQDTEPGKHAHIVYDPEGTKVLTAMINGTPVKALCGYVWVPSRDPMKFPLCPRCEEIFKSMQAMGADGGGGGRSAN